MRGRDEIYYSENMNEGHQFWDLNVEGKAVNIKTVLKEIGLEGVTQIYVAWDVDYWCTFV